MLFSASVGLKVVESLFGASAGLNDVESGIFLGRLDDSSGSEVGLGVTCMLTPRTQTR
jgi:hypothetical protein